MLSGSRHFSQVKALKRRKEEGRKVIRQRIAAAKDKNASKPVVSSKAREMKFGATMKKFEPPPQPKGG